MLEQANRDAAAGSRERVQLSGKALVLAAGLAWSFAGVFVRLAPHLDVWQFLALRSFGIACVFMIVYWARSGRHVTKAFLKLGATGLSVTFWLFIASNGYIIAAKLTTVANALFLSSCAPLISAILGYLLIAEKLSKIQALSLALGLVGLLIIFSGGYAAGSLPGNIAAIASAIGFAQSSLLMRKHRDVDFTPCLVAYGLLGGIAAAAMSELYQPGMSLPFFESLIAFLAGFLVIGLGYSLFLIGAPHVPAIGQTLLAQTETIFGPIWVWLIFAEVPSASTIEGGLIILVAVALMVTGARRSNVGMAPA